MLKFEDLKADAAKTILSASSLDKALKAYGLMFSFIPEYKFVFGSATGSTPGLAVNRRSVCAPPIQGRSRPSVGSRHL